MTSADDHRVITQLFFHIRYVFVDCLTRVSGCGKYVSYFFRVPGCVDATFNSPPPRAEAQFGSVFWKFAGVSFLTYMSRLRAGSERKHKRI